jgi:hypothetical protein
MVLGLDGEIWSEDNDAGLRLLSKVATNSSWPSNNANPCFSLSSPRPLPSCRARCFVDLFMTGIGLREEFPEVPSRGDAG